MQFEFELNTQLEMTKQRSSSMLEAAREDRRDERVNMQTQGQKEMIEQRKQGDSAKKFESSGNDIISGDASMRKFGL